VHRDFIRLNAHDMNINSTTITATVPHSAANIYCWTLASN